MKKETSFTPGPWRLHKNKKDQSIITGTTEGWGPDHLATIDTSGNPPERLANASLIAAAPELFEALSLFIQYEGSKDNLGLGQLAVARDKARAALAKARGE